MVLHHFHSETPSSFLLLPVFISGIPSEMDIKSAIVFFQCLWRVNNFLLCGYLVYDCLPEQASMPTDFSILLKFYDTLFSPENTKLYNKLNRLR